MLVEPQVADRHAVVSGEKEKEHEENRMRDVHIGKKGSETSNEEQPDKFRKTAQFEQEAPKSSSSSTTHVSLDSCEWQGRPSP